MPIANQPLMVPIAEAALALRMTRERVLRRIQTGELAGAQLGGKWFAEQRAVDALREQCQALQSATA